MTTLRFTQWYDRVIGTLYHLKLIEKTGFFSLRKILKDVLEYPTTGEDVFQIGKYLETKGFVNALFTIGDAQVEITPSGIVHWELNADANTSFSSRISEKLKIISSHLDVNSEAPDARDEIFEKINVILGFTNKIRHQSPDLDLDARILDLEFHKIKPDHELLLNKLFSIDQLPPIRKEVLYLREVLSR